MTHCALVAVVARVAAVQGRTSPYQFTSTGLASPAFVTRLGARKNFFLCQPCSMSGTASPVFVR